MEYRLNKIDTDIRKKMQEEIETDKVHANEKINIKKDLKEHDKDNIDKNKNKEINNKKRYITIDGIKSLSGTTFDVEAEKLDRLNVGNSNGRILDTKK